MVENPDFEISLWSICLQQQVELCKRLGTAPFPTEPHHIIGIATDLSLTPMHGLRQPVEGQTAGWYLWSGEYKEADDFFKPMHACHLLQSKPEIIKYLGLPVGYRFLIDDKGYEDVWYDEILL